MISRGFILLAVMLFSTFAADNKVATSTEANEDVAIDTNPATTFWSQAIPLYTDRDKNDRILSGYRTEIRSRWTEKNLYFLFSCPYEELSLHPNPSTATETNKLWNWDVAEVFIGSDFKRCFRGADLKRFEESPVFEIMPIARAIIDAVKPSLIHLQRGELGEATGLSLLQHGIIEIYETQCDAVCSQDLT